MNNSSVQELLEDLRTTTVPTYIFTGIFTIGLFGNLLVCATIMRQRHLHTSTYYLIASMALSDAFGCICLIIYTIFSLLFLYSNHLSILSKEIICDVIGVCSYSSYFTSTHTLTLISVDRYYALAKSPYRSLLKDKHRLIIAIILTWLGGFLVAMPLIDVGGVSTKFPYICDVTKAHLIYYQIYFVLVFLFEEIIPAIIIIYAYTCVAKALNHTNDAKSNMIAVKNVNKRKSAIRKIIVITVVFLILTAVLHITRLIVAFSDATVVNLYVRKDTQLATATNVLYGIAFLQPVVNPIIFCIMSKSFRKSMLFTIFAKSNDSGSPNTN